LRVGLRAGLEAFAELGEQLVDGLAGGKPRAELRELVQLGARFHQVLCVFVAELEAFFIEGMRWWFGGDGLE
jgi:hypothetical protein